MDETPTNPFMRTLTYIVLVGLVLGVIFVFIGFSNPYMGTLPLAYVGIGLIGFASTALLVELGAAAARWQPPARAPRPSLSQIKSDRPTNGE